MFTSIYCGVKVSRVLLYQDLVDTCTSILSLTDLGCIILTLVRCDSSVKHYPLTWTGTNYKFGHGEFESVQDLLHHFQNKPLIGSESGKL